MGLRPCPFCGKRPVTLRGFKNLIGYEDPNPAHYMCPSHTDGLPLEIWNKRTLPPEVTAVIEAAREYRSLKSWSGSIDPYEKLCKALDALDAGVNDDT